MNTTLQQGDPMSRRGGAAPSHIPAAAPPPTGQSPRNHAAARANDLATILNEVYGIRADIHHLRSGNAIASVFLGLLAYSDGERFWWTSPVLDRSGDHLLSAASDPATAAERLAAHYRILRARPAASLLESELPLLTDTTPAEHVVPR
ncbi:hypothetical protein [Streptosporangium sp. NPDC050280]|uniref:hypothetical protein n=1 Tax=unclassified Streptosporangium TaxID=2632669 RepID=UPI00344AC652